MSRNRWLMGLFLMAALTILPSTAVSAHEDEEGMTAIEAVRQAIAYIVNTPEDMDVIRERVVDATESDDQEGVTIPLVEQAEQALAEHDVDAARLLLLRAIGARPDVTGTDVRPILQVRQGAVDVELATGGQTGTTVAVDPLPGRRDLTSTDFILFGAAIAVVVFGVLLAWRWRPPDTVRTLRRRLLSTKRS